MKVNENRERPVVGTGALAPVDADGDGAVRTGYAAVLHAADLHPGGGKRGGQRGEVGAHLGDR